MQNPIVIAGGGIAGLSLALALSQRGWRVQVLEQAETLSDIGAGVQLSANAMRVLASLGVAEAVEQAGFTPEAVVFRHYRTGKPYRHFPLKGVHEVRYGAKYIHIHRADLIEILSKAVAQTDTEVHLGQEVIAYEQEGEAITALTRSGQRFTGMLLVGANGIKSRLLGSSPASFSGLVAWRGVVSAERASIPPDATAWLGRGKHFVSYYVRGGSLINFVALTGYPHWQAEDWQQEGDINEARRVFAGWDAPVGSLLNACESCYFWGIFVRPPLVRWHDGRVVLVGDACHSLFPSLAQGSALALEDALCLAVCLTESSLSVALSSYEAHRKPRAIYLQRFSRLTTRLYHASPLKKRLLFPLTRLNQGLFDGIYGYDGEGG